MNYPNRSEDDLGYFKGGNHTFSSKKVRFSKRRLEVVAYDKQYQVQPTVLRPCRWTSSAGSTSILAMKAYFEALAEMQTRKHIPTKDTNE